MPHITTNKPYVFFRSLLIVSGQKQSDYIKWKVSAETVVNRGL